jgi:hypothetical protein
MAEGFLLTPRALRWDTKPHMFLARGEVLVDGVLSLEAYRCLKCKLILFKYGEEEEFSSTT